LECLKDTRRNAVCFRRTKFDFASFSRRFFAPQRKKSLLHNLLIADGFNLLCAQKPAPAAQQFASPFI